MAAKRSTSAEPKAKPTPGKRTSARHRVRIRMYCHGLGDCFLLSFPRKGRKDFQLMIDCGVVIGTGEPGKVMRQVAEDVKKAVGGTLDTLVITHEHWDHLSGFDKAQARDVFASMEIKALWLGWPEDDTDSLAKSLRDERAKKRAAAKAAKEAATKLGLAEQDTKKKDTLTAQARRIAGVLGFFGVRAAGDDEDADGDDEEDNDDAGTKAQGGTRGALNFLKEKCRPTILQTGTSMQMPGVDDVRVYVIGPPKDGEAMRKASPHKGEGYGLGDTSISLADAFLAGFDPGDERAQPFDKTLRRPLSALREKPPPDGGAAKGGSTPGSRQQGGINDYYQDGTVWRNIDEDVSMISSDSTEERAHPFAKSMRRPLSALRSPSLPHDAAPGAPPQANTSEGGIKDYYKDSTAWRNIDNAWLATGERLALQLDNATNNTSLVLAIELGGEDGDVLLFVGDAQAGNWRSWEARSWEVEVKGKAAKTRRVTSADLLGRTIFYKVGHHGSHNATMREKGLELMKSDRLAAFIPVDTDVAHKVKGWVHMPLPAIRERLEKKCAVVFQSDMAAMEKRKIPGTRWEESPQQFEVYMKDGMTKKTKAVGKRPLYTDYFV